MKKLAIYISAALAVLSLSGCGKPKISCSNQEGVALLGQIVNDEANKIFANLKLDDEGQVLDAALVKSAMESLVTTVENIRTAKEDPNSTKVACEASLKITVPQSLLNDAEAGRKLLGAETIVEKAHAGNFEQSLNTFTRSIEYTLQPTDDGTKIVAQLVGARALADFVSELVGPALLKPRVESKNARIQILKIEQGLERFSIAVGRYPSDAEGLRALVERPSTASDWSGPYLEEGLPVDPWGGTYQYKSLGRNGAPDIFSLGADGKVGGDGQNADVHN